MTDDERTDRVDNLGAEATCAAGCDCNTSGSGGRARWITGILILVVAGVLVARAVIKDNGIETETDEATFAVIDGAEGPGKELATLADLNKVAAETDGVFVYLPGDDTDTAHAAPTSQIEAAVRTLKTQGITLGIFTLKTEAPEYAQLASQMAVPGVVVMAKGQGMVPVKGDITENSLIQSFVAASSAGGCGASAGPGCCP
jgi:hypothetical protein